MTGWNGIVVVALTMLASSDTPGGAQKAGKGTCPEPPTKSLVGVWVPVNDEMPKGSTIEFDKQGNLTITVKPPGMNAVPIKGTYKVKGKRIDIVTFDANGERSKDSGTIKVLTAKRLVLVDSKGRKSEFTRK
jgi:uncharacterized protein (TIGR03066 family)